MRPLTPNQQYASYVARHKWFVFRAGLRTGAPLWRLIIHDWSKLTPAEWKPYVDSFYGGERTPEVREAFDRAWSHHQHNNPHHWQYWLLQEDNGGLKVLSMPDHFIREMVADWMGAGRAITGKWEVGTWYAKNYTKIRLAEDTRYRVDNLVAEMTMSTWRGER